MKIPIAPERELVYTESIKVFTEGIGNASSHLDVTYKYTDPRTDPQGRFLFIRKRIPGKL
jgi:hypothetical protein